MRLGTKNRLLTVLVLTMCSIIIFGTQTAMANYWDEKSNIEKFLDNDETYLRFNWTKVYSGIYADYLAKNASLQNISLGRVYVYNPDYWNNGYVFNYHITSDGYIIFIDPQSNKIITWNDAKYRFKGNPKIEYVRYFHYYPYHYYDGVGELPYDMKRATSFY